MTNELIIIGGSLLFSAFFSGMEIAFISANKLHIEVSGKKGRFSSRLLARFLKSPSHFIGTSLVGNNITLVIFGIAMARLLVKPFENVVAGSFQSNINLIIFQTIITTLIVLIFGEFIPKVLFRIKPVSILTFFALPFRLIYFIFYPLVVLFLWLSKHLLKIFLRVEIKESEPAFETVDLQYFIQEADKKALEEETNIDPKIFENALYLRDVKVRECMVPRTEIQGIDQKEPIEKLREIFLRTKLSRIVVYEGSIDNIVGYAHHLEMLQDPKTIKEAVISIPVLPETLPANKLLDKFIDEQKSMILVVDEFGGTAGIVTLEDVMEEIFGEIEDEFDEEELMEQRISENEFVFSARLEVDYVNEKYQLEIPRGEYETIAGFILANFQNVPKPKQKIVIDNFEITVLESLKNKIEKINIKINPVHL
ncbi:MAG: HlyC/CorC family transporter [Bacteroidetes bacterium]|nr:HlyC/CorC family transporter [Bacteroidota bacterium]